MLGSRGTRMAGSSGATWPLPAFLGIKDVQFFAVEAATGDDAALMARKDVARHGIDTALAAIAQAGKAPE